MKKLLFVLIFIFSSQCFSQTKQQQDINSQIEELMKAREEMIKSLLNDSEFGNFDKRFEDLIKKFDGNNTWPDIGGSGAVIGEFDWQETNTHQIFILKVKQIKDKPLDIKIEKGYINLKGDVQSQAIEENNSKKTKTITKVHFERSFKIPEGVDLTSPEFESKTGQLLIKFKKIKSAKDKAQKEVIPDQRRPIEPGAEDISI